MKFYVRRTLPSHLQPALDIHMYNKYIFICIYKCVSISFYIRACVCVYMPVNVAWTDSPLNTGEDYFCSSSVLFAINSMHVSYNTVLCTTLAIWLSLNDSLETVCTKRYDIDIDIGLLWEFCLLLRLLLLLLSRCVFAQFLRLTLKFRSIQDNYDVEQLFRDVYIKYKNSIFRTSHS